MCEKKYVKKNKWFRNDRRLIKREEVITPVGPVVQKPISTNPGLNV